LTVVEYGVVNDDAVDVGVDICGQDCFLKVIAVNFAEGIAESTICITQIYVSYEIQGPGRR
jgi:hypothetical protein